jgi:formamidopyrimidine-DNA glycosylase
MDNKVVVGVGNIYATEALFYAKINPQRVVNTLTKKQWVKLITEIKAVLTKAIMAGGTTLKDYTNFDGRPGYFKQKLAVYGKAGDPCPVCKSLLKLIKQQGRSTVYCATCQV